MLLYAAFNLPEDHQHFHLFTNGDERGLSYLDKRLSGYISSYAYKIIANRFEINSIVQDAYIKAWNYRTNFHDIPHLINYLKQRAKWACYDLIRKNKDHLTISIEHCDYQLTNTGDCIAEAEQRIINESKWDMLEEAIAYLPGDKRAIVELWKDGLSYDSIAKAQNTTHQHITVEMKKIADHLKRINSRLVKAALAESRRPLLMLSDYRIYLNRQQCSIFKHYYEEACSLPQIAILLDITPFQLQQQLLYIKHIIDNKPQIQ